MSLTSIQAVWSCSTVGCGTDTLETPGWPEHQARHTIEAFAKWGPHLLHVVASFGRGSTSGYCAGIATTLKDNTTWTFLAPTNEIFDVALADQNLSISANLDKCNQSRLISILDQHIIQEGAYFVNGYGLRNGQELKTQLNGSRLAVKCQELEGDDASKCQVPTGNSASSITFSTPGGSNATITAGKGHRDIKAGISVVHIVDKVLMPPANVTKDCATAQSSNAPSNKAKPDVGSPVPAAGSSAPPTGWRDGVFKP